MPTFELRRLENYDDASLLNELRRVASIVEFQALTQAEFDRHSKASASVIRRRFGSWTRALELAGLADRYSGTPEAKRYLTRGFQAFTDEELLAELRVVAAKSSGKSVTIEEFNRHGTMNAETIRRRFGSWWRALQLAGLTISNRGKRYSEADYFENLLKVWTRYGRQPTYGEMDGSPSWIPAGAYESKWGTWRSALKAFLERVNADVAESEEKQKPSSVPREKAVGQRSERIHNKQQSMINSRRRDITLGLRYDVLRRDRFRCVICGSSPASKLECELHVDHITPVARGGKTISENLRTLCSQCNVGKAAKVEHEPSTV